MQTSFEQFLRGLDGEEQKAEYALPTLVDEQIRGGALSVRVADTDAVWFGVTYREDRDAVKQALRKMCDAGQYPEKLW